MKNTKFLTMMVLAIALAFAGLNTVSCAGKNARSKVMAPALTISAGGVEDDARVGVASFAESAQPDVTLSINGFFAAIASKDSDTIKVAHGAYWGIVKESADKGIVSRLTNREIGPLGANSLRTRLSEFDAALVLFVSK